MRDTDLFQYCWKGLKVHAIRVGTARQRDELVPKKQLWFRSAQRWVTDLGSVPKIEKQLLLTALAAWLELALVWWRGESLGLRHLV